MLSTFATPALTLLLLAIVIGLGIAFVWMLWEIEQVHKRRRKGDRSGWATVMRGRVSEMENLMDTKESLAQCEKRELDLQLDKKLEGTFPASDPPKITRFSVKSRRVAHRAQKDVLPRND